MKLFFKYFVCLSVVFGLFSIGVYAEMNLDIEYVDKYDDVGIYDVDVLINENFRLDSDKLEVTSLSDNFKVFDTCKGLDGNTLSDCNETAKKTIGYIYPENLTYSSESVELQEIPGEIILTFRDAATLNDETYVDVVVTINNIKIKRNREDIELNRPVVILRQGDEYMSNEANSIRSGFSVNYDINFELSKDDSVVEDLTMGIIFSDIDVYNKNNPEYSASIELISGIKDNKIYRLTDSENYLCINENNTKFTTAKVCGLTNEESWNLKEEEEKFKGGFALIVDSSSFKYNWTGSGCGTDISFITVDVVPEPDIPVDEPETDIPVDESEPDEEFYIPESGNVSKIIVVFVLLVVSGVVTFIFFEKNNKIS